MSPAADRIANPDHRRRVRRSELRHRLRQDHSRPTISTTTRSASAINLPIINIFTADAKINDNGPETYRGLDRFEARKRVIADLEEQGLMEEIKPHKLMVPRGDRSHAMIEPFLTDQWYVKTAPLAGPAIAAVKTGKIKFIPENWEKTYFDWMNRIEDWCISRQIWWGHRIPAWYDEQGKVYVGRSEAEVREKHQLGPERGAGRKDPDVLDTWFSSALWPFSTLGWPEQYRGAQDLLSDQRAGHRLRHHLLLGGRMIMMGLKFMGDVPFREVYIHGLVRDHDGQKMAKSKGNVLDPLDIIDGVGLEDLVDQAHHRPDAAADGAAHRKRHPQQFPAGIRAHGTDALALHLRMLWRPPAAMWRSTWGGSRATAISATSSGTPPATCPDEHRGPGYRFERRRIRTEPGRPLDSAPACNTPSRSQRSGAGLSPRSDGAGLYEFTWNEFCDWYLELSKPVLTDPASSEAAQRGTRQTWCGRWKPCCGCCIRSCPSSPRKSGNGSRRWPGWRATPSCSSPIPKRITLDRCSGGRRN
jgi:valyl-tRNA synthetase